MDESQQENPEGNENLHTEVKTMLSMVYSHTLSNWKLMEDE